MRARLRAFPWWAWTLSAIVAVVALVAAIGGFADTPVAKVPTISLGDVYKGRQVDSSVESVELANEIPGVLVPKEGLRYVVATVRLVNHDDEPVSVTVLDLLLLIDEIDYVESPSVLFSAREGGLVKAIQPGVPTEILYVFEVPSTVADDTDAIIGVLEAVPDPDSLYGADELGDALAVRRIDVVLSHEPVRAGSTS